MRISRFVVALALVAFCFSVGPVRAAEIHRYLPDDTELVIALNIKQLFSTKLFKDHVTGPLQDTINGSDEAKELLKGLGFDPLKDLHRVVIASPGSTEVDRGLIIIQGEFDNDKLKENLASLGKTFGLKVHKVNDGEFLIYEVTPPGQQFPWFFSAPARDAILFSPGKDYIVDAVKKNPLKNPPALKNKNFQGILEAIDEKQSLYLAATTESIGRLGLPENYTRDLIKQMDGVAGGVKLDEDLHVEVVFGAKTVADAKSMKDTFSQWTTLGTLALGLIVGQDPTLAPLVDILKSFKVTNKEKAVSFKARIDGELLEKLFELGK